MEVLEQLHLAPSMYLATVLEVVRRRSFSDHYLGVYLTVGGLSWLPCQLMQPYCYYWAPSDLGQNTHPPPPLVPICIIKYYLTAFIVHVSLFSKQLTCKIRKSPSLLSLSVPSKYFLLVNTRMLTLYWFQYIYSESFFNVKGTKLCCMFSLFPEQLAYEHSYGPSLRNYHCTGLPVLC